MKARQGKYLIETVEGEGFGYAFLHYSDFKDIEDDEFQQLRQDFINAAERLAGYIGVEI